MEIESKLKKMEALTEQSQSEEVVYVVQDFNFDALIAIGVNDLSDTLFKLKSMKNYQSGDAQMLQPFYLSNKKYHEIINHFERFNEMKSVLPQDHNYIPSLLDHFKKYMPVALQKIDDELSFTKKALDSCDELFAKLGKSCPVKPGHIVKL